MRILLVLCAAAALLSGQPWPTNGWTTSTPEAQGMDAAKLEAADAWIRANSPNRYSFLVIRNGQIVFERYYNFMTQSTAEHIASVSKSFLSAIAGIAVAQNLLKLDDRFFEVLPEYARDVQDQRTLTLTVRDQLRMAAGLVWDEEADLSRGLFAPNWLRFAVSRRFDSVPGQKYTYNTGNTHMLSALLTRKTGLSTREFAERHLFRPIGFKLDDWWTDQTTGFSTGGFGIEATARELAKFGWLYVNDGAWEGRQIVPAEWVRASTTPRIWKGTAGDYYGYLWHMDNRRGFFVANASGMGDQHIWFNRELKLVVVSTGNWLGAGGSTWRLMLDYVMPSFFRGAPALNPGGIVNAASNRTVIAPGGFATLYGGNLAPAEVSWDSVILDGRTLPNELGGVSVKIGGRDAWLSYASPTQVNVLVPADLPEGNTQVEVTHPGGSVGTPVTVARVAPGLFPVATYAGERVYVNDPGAYPGATSRPARRGDNLELFGTGLGPTLGAPPAGQVLAQYHSLADADTVRVYFGSMEALPQAINLTYAGLWQINVQVPPGVPVGEVPVTIRVSGETSPEIRLKFVN